MSTEYAITLAHDVNLDGVPIKAGSTIRMDGQPTLATACRLAGVDHQTFLRIRAYMPVQADLDVAMERAKLLELARMASKINPYGDRHNGLTRLKAQAILTTLGEGALDEPSSNATDSLTLSEGIERVMRQHRSDCASLTQMLMCDPPRPAHCTCGAQP